MENAVQMRDQMQTWADVEKRRRGLKISRAELCRRARISDTTVHKGLKAGTRPSAAVLGMLAFVFRDLEETRELQP